MLNPSDVLFIFLLKLTVFWQCLHKREEKMRESELMFGCHLREDYQLFYEKGAQIMQYVKTSQGNHIQPVV